MDRAIDHQEVGSLWMHALKASVTSGPVQIEGASGGAHGDLGISDSPASGAESHGASKTWERAGPGEVSHVVGRFPDGKGLGGTVDDRAEGVGGVGVAEGGPGDGGKPIAATHPEVGALIEQVAAWATDLAGFLERHDSRDRHGGAEEELDALIEYGDVARVGVGERKVVELVAVVLLDVGEHGSEAADEARERADREDPIGVVIEVEGDADLLEVIGAAGASSGFSSHLHGGKQEGDQDTDHGDDDQQFDEGESGSSRVGLNRDHGGLHERRGSMLSTYSKGVPNSPLAGLSVVILSLSTVMWLIFAAVGALSTGAEVLFRTFTFEKERLGESPVRAV